MNLWQTRRYDWPHGSYMRRTFLGFHLTWWEGRFNGFWFRDWELWGR